MNREEEKRKKGKQEEEVQTKGAPIHRLETSRLLALAALPPQNAHTPVTGTKAVSPRGWDAACRA